MLGAHVSCLVVRQRLMKSPERWHYWRVALGAGVSASSRLRETASLSDFEVLVKAASPLKCNITSFMALPSTGINPIKMSADAC